MSRTPSKDSELEDIEIQLLLEGVSRRYGYDFQDYSHFPIKRVIRQRMRTEGVRTISGFQEQVLHDAACMERFLRALSFPSKSAAHDPTFYFEFRQEVVPRLRTYPFIRLWHAGCSSILEIYSVAIMLQEEGLYDKSQIYVTDMNPTMLQRAEAGLFPAAAAPIYSSLYREGGGKGSFSDFYVPGRNAAIFHSALKRNVVFGQHNLTTDSSFNAFNVILCRHLLSYFNQALQARVHKTLYESLERFGILALGPAESLESSPYELCYVELKSQNKLYRKCK